MKLGYYLLLKSPKQTHGPEATDIRTDSGFSDSAQSRVALRMLKRLFLQFL